MAELGEIDDGVDPLIIPPTYFKERRDARFDDREMSSVGRASCPGFPEDDSAENVALTGVVNDFGERPTLSLIGHLRNTVKVAIHWIRNGVGRVPRREWRINKFGETPEANPDYRRVTFARIPSKFEAGLVLVDRIVIPQRWRLVRP